MDDGRLRWAQQQRGPKTYARPLGQVLDGLAGTVWFRRNEHLGKIVEALSELLPRELADHVAVEGLRRNALHLTVDSAPHRYELELAKAELLGAMNDRLSGVFIREIRLALGKPDAPDAPADKRRRSDDE